MTDTVQPGPPEVGAAAVGDGAVEVGAVGIGSVEIHQGDNLAVAAGFADGSFTLIYLDPPFNTGRVQGKALETAQHAAGTQAEANAEVDARSADSREGGAGAAAARLILAEYGIRRSRAPRVPRPRVRAAAG